MLTLLLTTVLHISLLVASLGLLVWGVPALLFWALGPLGRLLARLEAALEEAHAPPEPPLGGPFLPALQRPPSSA